jgi:hypothetical protein
MKKIPGVNPTIAGYNRIYDHFSAEEMEIVFS